LLVELDGFGSDAGVVCVAATNRVDVLDKALVRPGRFDRKITVQVPTREGRLQILKVHVRDKPLNEDVDLYDLAAEMNGFTGAIIANVVNAACLSAAREGRDDVCAANFDAAVEAETLGKTLPIDRGEGNDRRLARVHASCAVATALLMKDACKLNFVSIVPRETNMDGCVSLKDFPEVERPNAMTRSILIRHTRTCFVPQLAEEEHYGFDDVSFAAAPYTARAREVATMMVVSGGMAGSGSRLNYVPATDQFMIADFLRSDVVEMLLRSTTVESYFESDREARVMLQEQHAAARRFVKRQKAAIDALTDVLYEKKSVDDKEVDEILKAHAVPEPSEGSEDGFASPETRERLEPWTGIMPEGSVPATNEWIET
jgi:ATP-dependent Zn protease